MEELWIYPENKCQCCGKTENVCLIETQKETFTIRKYLCEECYSRSKGKGFVDLLNNELMFVKD
jgi:hypothetical protein